MDIIRTPASSGNIEVLNYLINAMKLCIDVKDHTNWVSTDTLDSQKLILGSGSKLPIYA